MDAHIKSRLVSAEEARKLLDAYHAPGSDRPLTLNNSADTAMFRAAPDLAATVIALTDERDRLLAAAKEREHRAAIVVKMNQDGAALAMEQLAQDAAAVEKERDRLRDILLSAVTAAKNATLPPGFIWGNDAMEQFNFGKERAAEAVAGAIEAADRAAKETK